MKKINLINRKNIYILIIIGLIFLSGLNFFGWFFLKGIKEQITTRLKQQILNLGRISTQLIESYTTNLDEIYPGMETSLIVRTYQQLLFDIKNDNDLENILILDLYGKLLIDSRLDFTVGDSLIVFPLNRDKFQTAALGEIPEPIFIQEGEQYFMTTYTPIINNYEEPIAVLVIDVPLEFFTTLHQFELGSLYFALGGLTIVILFSIIIILATNRLFRAETEIKEKEQLAQLGQMAASVAHEIRNPLSIIKGTADVLQKKYTNTDEELLSFIPEEINRLNRLVEDFLQFAKNKKLNITPQNIGELVSSIINQIKDTRISVDLQNNLPEVKVDSDAIRQILLNIIYNALDSISDNGNVWVEARTFPLNAYNVSITIKDNGKGISKENLKNIFQPFFSTKASGSGLGLSICKQLIEQQNGKISINSREKEGTTVELLLPTND